MRSLSVAACLAAAGLLVAGGAGAVPGVSPSRVVAANGSSLSIGHPARGHLRNGALLTESDHVRYRSGTEILRFGTDELVATLQRAARAVAVEYPGPLLTVGDLSRRGGGRFRPHRSHRNGRDVDIAFYMKDADGNAAYHRRFVRFRGDGRTRASEFDYRFDDVRNWALVASLVTAERAPVQFMFISRGLRRRLLAEGERQGASADVLDRASRILFVPRRGGRHNDHFHMRVYCAPDDRPRCNDRPPFYDWYPLSSGGVLGDLNVPAPS